MLPSKFCQWVETTNRQGVFVSMVVEMVPLKGGIGSIWGPPEGKDYKYEWYISGIYCQLGDYMPPTTF